MIPARVLELLPPGADVRTVRIDDSSYVATCRVDGIRFRCWYEFDATGNLIRDDLQVLAPSTEWYELGEI